MTREQRLVSCLKCRKRDFTSKDGVVCGLTMQQANFHENCQDFIFDQSVLIRESLSEQSKHDAVTLKKTDGFYAGLAMIVVSIMWMLLGLYYNLIFYYPFFLFLIGSFKMISNLNFTNKVNKSDLLDGGFK